MMKKPTTMAGTKKSSAVPTEDTPTHAWKRSTQPPVKTPKTASMAG